MASKDKNKETDEKGKPEVQTQDAQDKEIAAALDLATATLTGDVRDFLLDRVKGLGKPWAAMTEDEQSDQIHAAKSAADQLVRKACQIIAAQGKKAINGKLENIAIKDKIQCRIDFNADDEQRHELFDAKGYVVSVVLADAQPFTGERGPAEPDPTQGDMLDKAEKLKKGKDKVTAIKPRAYKDDDDSEE